MNKAEAKIILLVDDNLEFAETIRDYLIENTEFKVEHCRSGRAAFDYLQRNSKSVVGVLSDLMMSDMDGIDFLAKLRKSSNLVNLPLIMISGADPLVFETLLRPYKFSAFLSKPVDLIDLAALVNQHFSGVWFSESA